MKKNIFYIAIAIFFLCVPEFVLSQKSGKKSEEPTELIKDSPTAKPSVTHHSIIIGGKTILYTATAGYLRMDDDAGKHKANMFFVAYEKEDENLKTRPITYAFNGGPGSSSVWLHIGALGPKRIVMDDEGNPTSPPYSLTENEFTWLEFTDLVFIDPVSTGFSRPASGEEKKQFHGVNEDATSVGEFIRLYTTRNKRWLSPKYLAGESYGTTRAAMLSGYLQDTYGMNLNGIVLISTALNFQTIRMASDNDLAYQLFLPSFTATAFYHKKLATELQSDLLKTLEEARKWANSEYMIALDKGDALTESERQQVAKKLSYFTGISTEYILNANLRLDIFRFSKELLRSERRTVGRLDSRFKGIDANAAGERPDYDPSYDGVIYGPYSAAINDYLRTELGVENDLNYEILTGKVQPWNWGSASGGYANVNVAEVLAEAMNKNKYMKVFVANGYFDLATPFNATEYTFNHLGLEAGLHENITMDYFPAGHMMYVQKSSLKKLTEDVANFYRNSIGKK